MKNLIGGQGGENHYDKSKLTLERTPVHCFRILRTRDALSSSAQIPIAGYLNCDLALNEIMMRIAFLVPIQLLDHLQDHIHD